MVKFSESGQSNTSPQAIKSLAQSIHAYVMHIEQTLTNPDDLTMR